MTAGDRQKPVAIVSIQMQLLKKRLLSIFWSFSAFLLLSSCGEQQPSCDSLEVRNLVVKTIADDKNNSLVNYAAKNSSMVAKMVAEVDAEADKLSILEKAKEGAVYTLDNTVIVNSRNRATQTLSCSGILSVTVEDTTAQKQVDFTVEQPAKGIILVSVKPFLF
jgi:hypothetical protein